MTEESTTLATLPGSDLDVVGYHKEALGLLAFAEKRVIASQDDVKLATDDLSIISRLKKQMEAKRKDYIAPLLEQQKAINETYKTLMNPILKADQITRLKVIVFNAEQDKIRKEQEEINRLRKEAADKDAALHNGEISESVNLVEVSEGAPKTTRTDMGSASTMMIKKWKLVDMAQVPEEYKILDSARVTKVVKASISSIPGIEIYEEPTLSVRAK